LSQGENFTHRCHDTNHKTQIYEKAIEKFSIFCPDKTPAFVCIPRVAGRSRIPGGGSKTIIRLGNGFLRFKEKGGKEKELPVHHKLEELLDSKRPVSANKPRLSFENE
jgi:hypothetical protein